jgi:hypothetical protein
MVTGFDKVWSFTLIAKGGGEVFALLECACCQNNYTKYSSGHAHSSVAVLFAIQSPAVPCPDRPRVTRSGRFIVLIGKKVFGGQDVYSQR